MKRLNTLLVCLGLAVVGCGKKEKEGQGGGGAAAMMVPVVAAEAAVRPVVEKLALVGTLQANEVVEITAEADGIVAEVAFQEGQPVEKGKLLLRLDETKFAAALAEAEGNDKLSRSTFERAKQLLGDRLISQQEFDEASARYAVTHATLERRARELKDARIHAPFSGTVGARLVSPGQVIARGAKLTTIVDTDPIKAEITIPERFLGQVKIGQEMTLSVAAFPGKTFTGKVYFIAPQIDPGTRTALVKAEIPNPEMQLRPGMFANLDLTLQVRERGVVIPEASLTLTQNKTTVWVIGADDSVQPREVKVGLRMAGEVEILEGLKPGEKIVVEGIQKLGPGAKVAVANTSSAGTNQTTQAASPRA